MGIWLLGNTKSRAGNKGTGGRLAFPKENAMISTLILVASYGTTATALGHSSAKRLAMEIVPVL